MKNELDELLKHALTPTDEPDFQLNQNIINQVKEQEKMKKRIWKRIPVTALTAAIVLGCASLTVCAGAIVKYLSARDVAEKMEDTKLADAFSGKDAIFINETQSYGGYDVTLLGIVSGKDLSKYKSFENGIQLEDRTYSVIAIQHTDGTPMADIGDAAFDEESFFASPLIRDFNPNFYNAFLFNGGYEEFVENGVRYRLVECDNVEIFADHGLYLCVCNGDTISYNSEAYQFDEATGIISRNEDYSEVNALFDLPIDASKADPKAAENYLKEIGYEEVEDEPDLEEENFADKNKWRHQITPENIDMYADRLEDSVQVLTPDEENFIHYEYKDAEGNRISDGKSYVSDLFEQEETFIINGIAVSSSREDGEADTAYINTLQAKDDGTVTYACYRVKQSVLDNK